MASTTTTTTTNPDVAAFITPGMVKIVGKIESLHDEAVRLVGWADCMLLDLANLKPADLSQRRYAAALRDSSPFLTASYASDASLRTRLQHAVKLGREHGAANGAELGKALDLVRETTGKSATTRSTGKGKGKGSTSGKGKANGGAGGNEGKAPTVPDAIDAMDAASLAVAADPSKVGKAERHQALQALKSAAVLALQVGVSQDDILTLLAEAAAANAAMPKSA